MEGVDTRCWVVDVLLDDRGLDEWLDDLDPAPDRQERTGIDAQDAARRLRDGATDGGRVELRTCRCSCEGCDPLWARVQVHPDEVVWTDLAEGCLEDPVPDLEMRFDRLEYDRALADLARAVDALPRTAAQTPTA